MEIDNLYVPNAWQLRMHSSQWLWAAMVGGKGGGKTKGAIEEIKACAIEFPRTTYLLGRKTLPSLKDTTWREFIDSMPLGLIKDYNKTDRNVTLINDSLIIGRSLDEPKKLESLTLSGFLIDEADEIDKFYFDTLKTRVREVSRGPQNQKIIPRYRGILSLNPTDEDHWIPQLFLFQKPKDHVIFFSSTLDNLENLPESYVQTLKDTYTEDMQQRMIYGQFGRVHKGRPVFPMFSRGCFIENLTHISKSVIFRGWDFGYNNPACIWLQFIDGQARVLAEKIGSKIYLEDFIREEVMPYQRELFADHYLYADWCDPRGSDESDKGKSSVDILNEHGFYPKYRRTRINEGIKAMRDLLNTKNHKGEPNFLIHGRCKRLVEALRGGYHRDDGGEDPVKDGYYDHAVDALRYCLVNLQTRHRMNKLQGQINSQSNVFIHPVTGRRIEV